MVGSSPAEVFQDVEEDEPARSGGRLGILIPGKRTLGGGELTGGSYRQMQDGWRRGRRFASVAFAGELHPVGGC